MRSERTSRTKGTESGARSNSLAGDQPEFLRTGFFVGVSLHFLSLVTAAGANRHACMFMRAIAVRRMMSVSCVMSARQVIVVTVVVHRWQQPAAHQVGHESDAGNPEIHGYDTRVRERQSLSSVTDHQ